MATIGRGLFPVACSREVLSLRFRSVFLSDLHLGTRACKVEFLQCFLDAVEAEHLFLVGDIVDMERMQRRWYWPSSHREVLRRLLDMPRRGTRVLYLPGNHDGQVEHWDHLHFGDLEFRKDHVHVLADGRRILLTHGDIFDSILHVERLYGMLGRLLYSVLVGVNHGVNLLRGLLGLEYWSLADHVKRRMGKVKATIGLFTASLVQMARSRGCDAVLAGHVHLAGIERHGDVLYCNSGDWVDSCTAIVEDFDGQLRLIEWAGRVQELPAAAASLSIVRPGTAAVPGVAACA